MVGEGNRWSDVTWGTCYCTYRFKFISHRCISVQPSLFWENRLKELQVPTRLVESHAFSYVNQVCDGWLISFQSHERKSEKWKPFPWIENIECFLRYFNSHSLDRDFGSFALLQLPNFNPQVIFTYLHMSICIFMYLHSLFCINYSYCAGKPVKPKEHPQKNKKKKKKGRNKTFKKTHLKNMTI